MNGFVVHARDRGFLDHGLTHQENEAGSRRQVAMGHGYAEARSSYWIHDGLRHRSRRCAVNQPEIRRLLEAIDVRRRERPTRLSSYVHKPGLILSLATSRRIRDVRNGWPRLPTSGRHTSEKGSQEQARVPRRLAGIWWPPSWNCCCT